MKRREDAHYRDTGRAMTKEEQRNIDVFVNYRSLKSQFKLLKALLSKKSQ